MRESGDKKITGHTGKPAGDHAAPVTAVTDPHSPSTRLPDTAAGTRIESLFDQVAVGVVHTTTDGRILEVNRKLCEMLGYSAAELLGKTTRELTHPGDRDQQDQQRLELLEGKRRQFASEKRYLRKDGSVIWVSRTVALVRDPADGKEYLIQTLDGIDERYRATFDNAPIGIMHTAIDSYKILHVNPKLCEMLGYTQDELLNMTSTEVVHPDDRFTDASKYQGPMLKGDALSFSSERRFICKDGSLLWVNRTVSLARDVSGKPLYYIRIVEDITERKQAREIMARERALLRTIIDALPDHIYVKDRDGSFLLANKAWLAVRGEKEQDIVGKTAHDYFSREVAERMATQDLDIVTTGIPLLDVEQRMIIKRLDGAHGPARWASTTKVPLRTATGEIIGTAGISRDITERKQSAACHAMEHAVTRLLAEAVTVSEAMPRIMQTMCQAMGWAYGARWALDKEGGGLSRADYWCATEPEFDPADREMWVKVPRSGSGRLLRRAWIEKAATWLTHLHDDAPFRRKPSLVKLGWQSAYAFPILVDNQTIGIMEFFGPDNREPDPALLQVTQAIGSQIGQFIQRKEAEDKVAFLAQFDIITDLPNRFLFTDRLDQMLAQSERNSWSVGILFVDLDHFKSVNDTHGHAAGDKLLRQVAMRIKECVRKGDTVGRLSGDEFTVMLSNLANIGDAGLVAQKIVESLSAPFDLDGPQTYISASIGIALYPSDGENADTLLKNADTAMYLAKDQGRNGYQFYLPQMKEQQIQRQQLDTQLRGALDRKEFLLHYQPKVSLVTGAITGFEALLRWQRDGQMIPPSEFIPIMEDTGLIVQVGAWVLDTACKQIKQWEQEGIPVRPVAVNLSARQFQRKNLPEVIRQVLQENKVEPSLLKLELTESLLMSDAKESIETLHQLKALGVQLSVDDFGTGYSSLAYLRRFPLDELKIDREFIRDAVSDPDDAAIALTIINLAHSLKLRVVAEGVETEGQLNFLRSHGCDEVQGFYLARPQPPAECARMLAEDNLLPQPRSITAGDVTTLLLVVSNEAELQLLTEAYTSAGYRIMTARNANDGFEFLARQSVNIVIIDNEMPEMSGVEFLTRVRKLHPDTLRVLVSSGDDTPTLTRATNKAGIHLFLPYGWTAERLCAEMREALQAQVKGATADDPRPILKTKKD